jgi:hypothetical protein
MRWRFPGVIDAKPRLQMFQDIESPFSALPGRCWNQASSRNAMIVLD